MAKGSLRQRNKKQKQQLVKKAAQYSVPKPDKLTFNQLNTIVTQKEKQAVKSAREKERRANNKKLIEEYGLEGFKPSDGTKRIQEAVEKVIKERERQRKKAIKERNEKLLTDAKILHENFPKRWTVMEEEELKAWIEKYHEGKKKDRSKLISSDVWLYIGWGDRSGNEDPYHNFSSGAYYGKLTLKELREGIIDAVNTKGVDGSAGRAGDTVIEYGKKEEVYAYMKVHEKLGYQTIFFGNELKHRALMRYTAACVDSSPESNRKYIVQKINAFLEDAGYKDLKLKL